MVTTEELEKEAEKNISNLKNNSIKVSGKPFQINEGDYTQGYLDGAEPREKRIEELEAQIEKMKCDVLSLIKDRMNDDIDQNIIERLAEKWEIKEK